MVAPVPNSFCKILITTPLLATRLWLVLGSFLWAVLLAWPEELFSPGRVTYSLMAKVAPELIWAAAFFVQSAWAFYTLRTGTKNHVTLAMDAFLGCILWTSSTLLCFAAHWPHQYDTLLEQIIHYPPPAAMSGELILSIASWWHLVRYWAEENTTIEKCAPCEVFQSRDELN